MSLSQYMINSDRIENSVETGVVEFRKMKARVRRQAVILGDEETGEVVAVQCWKKSRYFEAGRDSIRRKLRKRFEGKARQGVMVTLTEDPKTKSRASAWKEHNAEVSRFLAAVRKQQTRRGRAPFAFLACLEEQPGTGYPHTHIWFPGVTWVAWKGWITATWGRGFTKVEASRTGSISGYVMKYVSALKGWSEAGQAYLWKYGLRLYRCSLCLRVAAVAPGEGSWVFLGLEMAEAESDLHEYLVKMACRRGWRLTVW